MEVGSILEYSYQLRINEQYFYVAPEWVLQKKYFVDKAHYEFAPSGFFGLIWRPFCHRT